MNRLAAGFHGCALIAIVACVACQSEPGAGDSDPALLGTWTGTELNGDGSVWTMVFSIDEVQASSGDVEVYAGTYAVDVQADPHELTVAINSSGFPDYVGKITNALYEIAGDQLTLAANEPGNASRPTGFTPTVETRVFQLAKQ